MSGKKPPFVITKRGTYGIHRRNEPDWKLAVDVANENDLGGVGLPYAPYLADMICREVNGREAGVRFASAILYDMALGLDVSEDIARWKEYHLADRE